MWKVEIRVPFKDSERTYYEYFSDHKLAMKFYEGLKKNHKIHRKIMKVRMRTVADIDGLLALYQACGD